ncbi:MAG: hypothetical protein WBR26_02445 [Candidatus Acidiferrum sp.]
MHSQRKLELQNAAGTAYFRDEHNVQCFMDDAAKHDFYNNEFSDELLDAWDIQAQLIRSLTIELSGQNASAATRDALLAAKAEQRAIENDLWRAFHRHRHPEWRNRMLLRSERRAMSAMTAEEEHQHDLDVAEGLAHKRFAELKRGENLPRCMIKS